MPQKIKKTVVIVGGGIGGLTTALCFQKIGWNTIVLEKSNNTSEFGAGLQLSPNSIKILQKLNLSSAIKAKGYEPKSLEMRMGISGKNVMSLPLSSVSNKRWFAPYIHIHRFDLISILKKALTKTINIVYTNCCVVSYQQQGELIEAVLHDGKKIKANMLVGADGLNSNISKQMFPKNRKDYTGNVAWRSVVDVKYLNKQLIPDLNATVWLGKNKHAVTTYIKSGTLLNFVAVIEQQNWQSDDWSLVGNKQELLKHFKHWHPTLIHIIDKAEKHYRWTLFDKKPYSSWSKGKAVLLGDSCHPMLPSFAQGASQAIEDAWTLAHCVNESPSLDSAFINYYRIRINRVTRIQNKSKSNLKLFHRKNILTQTLSYSPIKLISNFLPSLAYSKLDWIYGYDVVNHLNSQTKY